MNKTLSIIMLSFALLPVSVLADSTAYEDEQLHQEAISNCKTWAADESVAADELDAYLENCVPEEYQFLTSPEESDEQPE